MKNAWRFGLLGKSIAYTKSPDIFRSISRHTGCGISFEVLSVEERDLAAQLGRLRTGEVDGLAATVPYKRILLSMLDEVQSDASRIGAVNCIEHRDGRLIGHNTDWKGFGAPLRGIASVPSDSWVLVLGAGGAARAAVYSLNTQFGVHRFTVLRYRDSAGDTRNLVTSDSVVEMAKLSDLVWSAGELSKYSMIVNATPLGGWNAFEETPFPSEFEFRSGTVYYDLNYNQPNRLIEAARHAGCRVFDGKAMLVGQAIESFRIWTGLDVASGPVLDSVFGVGV